MKKNFTEIGANIGGKIDSRINKTKEFVKAHKKQLIIGGAAVGAIGAGATAFAVYQKQKNEPEQIPESVEQEDENDSVVNPNSESSQEVPEE